LVQYKLAVMVLQCQLNREPKYLVDYCFLVYNVASCECLRSTSPHHLTVPRCQRSTFGRRAFSVGADDLECTVRRSLRSVVQCWWLPANIKDSIVHQILVYQARLRWCMKLKSCYMNLLLTLTLT